MQQDTETKIDFVDELESSWRSISAWGAENSRTINRHKSHLLNHDVQEPLRFSEALGFDMHSIMNIRIQMNHHHHQVPDLEQTLATMPLQTSLSSDNFKKLNPYFVHLLPSYKDYQEMLFVVCPYRVCLLLYQLKIRIPSLYVYTHVLKIPFASF